MRTPRGYVHWGATSQDMIDTATMLDLRAAIDVLLPISTAPSLAFAALARTAPRHADGGAHLAAACAADAVRTEARRLCRGARVARATRLKRLRSEALVLQFGGAAGTLAALGDKGLECRGATRRKSSNLPLPEAPWHTHRDRLAEVGIAFAILAGTCGKIARDVSLLMQTEVGEAFEPAGARPRRLLDDAAQAQSGRGCRGACRARRSRRNLAATILAAQIQEHERSAGAWAAEWPTFPGAALVTSGALGRDRRHRRRPRSRCRAHARQSRHHARTDHGGSGVDGARRKNRQSATRTSWSRRRARRPSPKTTSRATFCCKTMP